LLEAWELLASREEYIHHGWSKCGMGELSNLNFQLAAVEEVRNQKLLSPEVIARDLREAKSKAVEENETSNPELEEDVELTPNEVMDKIQGTEEVFEECAEEEEDSSSNHHHEDQAQGTQKPRCDHSGDVQPTTIILGSSLNFSSGSGLYNIVSAAFPPPK
jgi:hypothetical protein